MPNRTAEEREADELREAIARITGRTPASTDLRYLRERYQMLKEKKRDGEEVEREVAQGHVVTSVSMHAGSKAAAVKLAEEVKLGFSQLVRTALAEYARKRGFPALAVEIAGEE